MQEEYDFCPIRKIFMKFHESLVISRKFLAYVLVSRSIFVLKLILADISEIFPPIFKKPFH